MIVVSLEKIFEKFSLLDEYLERMLKTLWSSNLL